MNNFSELPWMKINDFLLNIENIQDQKQFCIQVLKNISTLIPYDQARIYFVNDNGKKYDEFLIGVEQWWSDVYIEYYSKIENNRYSIFTRKGNSDYTLPMLKGSVYNWKNKKYSERNSEFIADYIKPQGLNYSLGFGLHDADESITSSFSIDRTCDKGYTNEEIKIMTIIKPHLQNLYSNLFLSSLSKNYNRKNPDTKALLTKRESEIADLLCKGITPANISKKLFLSLPTIYKHIANIHSKLNVSNRQELILLLMNSSNSCG